MNQFNWIFLSYLLSESLSAYGGGERIIIEKIRSQEKGDSSNNSRIILPSHFGTHIDFPLHFGLNKRSVNNYVASDFIFNNIIIIDISSFDISDKLITVNDLMKLELKKNTNIDFLIIKTGFSKYRESKTYWEKGWGFDIGTAKFLKKKFIGLRAVGFDLISLSSYQHRVIGRKAHKEYLIDNDILIVEDMDLRKVFINSQIKELIVSPLRFEYAEGTPVTILAKISNA